MFWLGVVVGAFAMWVVFMLCICWQAGGGEDGW
jgi:hypothetical protein